MVLGLSEQPYYCSQCIAATTCCSWFHCCFVAAAGTAPAGAVLGKRIQADWCVVLGEAALDIRTGRVTANTRAGV
jgi:hypothetical protein